METQEILSRVSSQYLYIYGRKMSVQDGFMNILISIYIIMFVVEY